MSVQCSTCREFHEGILIVLLLQISDPPSRLSPVLCVSKGTLINAHCFSYPGGTEEGPFY